MIPSAEPDLPERLRLDHALAALLLAAMAVIAFANVLSRYLLHSSIAFTEEITVYLFVWLTVIGAGLAFERGAHLGMVSLVRRMPGPVQRALVGLGAGLGVALFMAVNGWLIRSIYLEVTVFHARAGSLPVPLWVFYAGVPVLSLFVARGIWRGAAMAWRPTER